MFPLKKKRKNTIEKKLKLKIRIKIRANLLSVNWTIQFPGSGENNCSRPSSKIESLSLYISLPPPFRERKYSCLQRNWKTVSIVISWKFFWKFHEICVSFIFNRVWSKKARIFYFEYVLYEARILISENVRILFHDRTVLSQQANNISSSFSKCSLCQKVLRFTRTAHKGGFTSMKKLKRRLLEPCPSSSIPPILCKGRVYIRSLSSIFVIFPPLSLSLDLYTSCFARPAANLSQISYIPNS